MAVGAGIAVEVVLLRDADAQPRPPQVSASALKPKPITLPELSKAIGSMSPSRAVAVDGVPLHAIVNRFAVIDPPTLGCPRKKYFFLSVQAHQLTCGSPPGQ